MNFLKATNFMDDVCLVIGDIVEFIGKELSDELKELIRFEFI